MLNIAQNCHFNTLKAAPNYSKSFHNVTQSPKMPKRILPIRVLHQKVTKTQHIQKKLVIQANKHISRLAAIGPETLESLYHIQNAKSVKTIRKFEFDPYLAESSCLTALIMAQNRLKNVREANIVIRRLDKLDIAQKKTFMMHKFRRLTKFRGELVYNGENTTAPNYYLQNISKCFSLTSLTLLFINLPFAYDKACFYMAQYRRRLLRLEEYNLIKYKTYECLNAHEEEKHIPYPPFRLCRLKKFSICIGLKPGWMSITDDFIKMNFAFLDFFNKAKEVEELNIKFIKFPTVLEFMAAFLEVLPSLPNLKRLKLNFIRSHIGDIEIIELANNINKIKSLKQFTFKLFQYPNVSGDAIRFLVHNLTKTESIEKFDFYARRLDMLNDQIDELVEDLRKNQEIQCSRFKQSLHAYKLKQLK